MMHGPLNIRFTFSRLLATAWLPEQPCRWHHKPAGYLTCLIQNTNRIYPRRSAD